MKKPKQKHRLWKKAAGVLLAAYGLQQGAYAAHTVATRAGPSPQRAAIEQEFGFHLDGYKRDIENDTLVLAEFVSALEREWQERPFQLSSIRIRSRNILQQSAIDHLDNLLGGHAGHYNPLSGGVVLSHGSFWMLHHEIKHRKIYEILSAHPEFREEWKRLAQDADGSSLYLSAGEQVLVYANRENMLGRKKRNDAVNFELGFINIHGRTNFYEDAAELGEEAERDPYNFIEWLHGGQRNERIAAKIRLAERYGLIPREFSEFVSLAGMRLGINSPGKINTERAGAYIEASNAFLQRNPGSVYELDVRYKLGNVLYYISSGHNIWEEGVRAAIYELKMALRAPVRERPMYLQALGRIGDFYRALGDNERAEVYHGAQQMFRLAERLDPRIRVIQRRIENYLKANGENTADVSVNYGNILCYLHGHRPSIPISSRASMIL